MIDHPGKSLDELLDRVLASYTPTAPRLGLEERVLARLAADSSRRRAWFSMPWVWTSAVAFVAVAVLLAVLLRPGVRPVRSNLADIERRPPSTVLQVPRRMHLATAPQPIRKQRLVQREPAQAEQLLSLTGNATQALVVLARSSEAEEESIEIKPIVVARMEQEKPIEIKPLESVPQEIEPIQIKPIEDNSAKDGGSN